MVALLLAKGGDTVHRGLRQDDCTCADGHRFFRHRPIDADDGDWGEAVGAFGAATDRRAGAQYDIGAIVNCRDNFVVDAFS